MSDVQKFKCIGYMVGRSRLGGAEYVFLSDLDRVTAERDAALSLSVTKIMLDIVHGYDGMGEEVYAKSVEDVEHAFTKLYGELERLTDQRDALQQRLTAADDHLDDCGNFQQMQIAVIQERNTRVEVLEGLLREVKVLITAEPFGVLSGMGDQSKRMDWYEKVSPVRDRIDAALKPAEADQNGVA